MNATCEECGAPGAEPVFSVAWPNGCTELVPLCRGHSEALQAARRAGWDMVNPPVVDLQAVLPRLFGRMQQRGAPRWSWSHPIRSWPNEVDKADEDESLRPRRGL